MANEENNYPLPQLSGFGTMKTMIIRPATSRLSKSASFQDIEEQSSSEPANTPARREDSVKSCQDWTTAQGPAQPRIQLKQQTSVQSSPKAAQVSQYNQNRQIEMRPSQRRASPMDDRSSNSVAYENQQKSGLLGCCKKQQKNKTTQPSQISSGRSIVPHQHIRPEFEFNF